MLFQLSQLHLPKDLLQIANIFLGNLHFFQMSDKMFSVTIFSYLSHVMIVLYDIMGSVLEISYSLGNRIMTPLLVSEVQRAHTPHYYR